MNLILIMRMIMRMRMIMIMAMALSVGKNGLVEKNVNLGHVVICHSSRPNVVKNYMKKYNGKKHYYNNVDTKRRLT